MNGAGVLEGASPSAFHGSGETLLKVENLDIARRVPQRELRDAAGRGAGHHRPSRKRAGTSLAKALFGLVAPASGRITLDGADVPLGDPVAAARAANRLCAGGPADRGAVS